MDKIIVEYIEIYRNKDNTNKIVKCVSGPPGNIPEQDIIYFLK